jgi:hypothetical protein
MFPTRAIVRLITQEDSRGAVPGESFDSNLDFASAM